jgi:hypothetical protein
MLTDAARRAAVGITVLTPIFNATGLVYAEHQANHLIWEGRVLRVTLAAAVLVAVLVVLAGAAPPTSWGRPLRVTAAVLLVVGVGVTLGGLVWYGQGCDTGSVYKVPLLAGGWLVVAGAFVWPWVVQAAPGRRSRWLIGPAAAVYLLATTFALVVVRDILFNSYGGCGE